MSNSKEFIKFLQGAAPLTWVGSGMSLALCALGSTLCEMSGISSRYSLPADVTTFARESRIVVVSASGRALAGAPLLRIVSSSAKPNVDQEGRLLLLESPAQSWLSSAFAESFVRWAAETFCPERVSSVPKIFDISKVSSRRNVFLVDKNSSLFMHLARACHNKIAGLNFDVISVEEFGHGFHHRIWADPTSYELVFLTGRGEGNALSMKVKHWLQGQSVIFKEIDLVHRSDTPEYVLQIFHSLLNFVVSKSRNMGVDPELNPLPFQVDVLR